MASNTAVQQFHIPVNDSLFVIVFFGVSESSPTGGALAISRKGGGRVMLDFAEISGLLVALTEGHGRLKAAFNEQEYEGDLPF